MRNKIISSGSKIVKRRGCRQYPKAIIKRTTCMGLVLGPFTAVQITFAQIMSMVRSCYHRASFFLCPYFNPRNSVYRDMHHRAILVVVNVSFISTTSPKCTK